jgi:hypothetical protein
LWDAVAAHFFTQALMSRIVAISEAEVQVEGWLKGELIWLFGQLMSRGVIENWRCECRIGERSRKRLDFKIELDCTDAATEVKTAIRQQKGISYDLRWYAQQANGFFPPDIRKLAAYGAANRYLLVFAYPAPPASEWDDALSELGKGVQGAAVSLAKVYDSPQSEISIGWLEVTTGRPAFVPLAKTASGVPLIGAGRNET